MKPFIVMLQLIVILMPINNAFNQSWVSSTLPAQNTLDVSSDANIVINFAENINSSTLTNNTIKVNGSRRGNYQSSRLTYDSSNRTATFDPDLNFMIGEVITVTLTKSVQNENGESIPSAYSWHFTVQAMAGLGKFKEKPSIVLNSVPESIISGDWNADGNVDLVVLSPFSHSISFYPNDGKGHFVQSLITTLSFGPISVTSGDMDNDGDLDLAMPIFSIDFNRISVGLNDGNGFFAESTPIDLTAPPHGITHGDWEGDGDFDLAVPLGVDSVSILLNIGNNSFFESEKIGVGISPSSIVTGDWDSDGDIDLAVANRHTLVGEPGTVSILKNDGTGKFAESSKADVETYPLSITTGDWDGDADLDLAVSSLLTKVEEPGVISILNNDGDGEFGKKARLDVGIYPRSITNGDWNSDGDLDLAVVNENQLKGGTVLIFENDGKGAYTSDTLLFVEIVPRSITAGDWNKDGDLDLAVPNWNEHPTHSTISMLQNNSTPALTSPISDVTYEEDSGRHIVVSNLNDNFEDVDDTLTFFSKSLGRGIVSSINGATLEVSTVKDSFGVYPVEVTTTDGQLSVSYTLRVTITPINDAPSTFNLLLPSDGDTVDTEEVIHFAWSKAVDADHDTVTYSLVLRNSHFDTTFKSIKDTIFALNPQELLEGRSLYYWSVIAGDGMETASSVDTFSFVTSAVTTVEDNSPTLPKIFTLHQNYPNPFNPSTTIRFDLPEMRHVTLKIYSLFGQEIRTLIDEPQTAGFKSVIWDGKDSLGQPVSSGVYIYKIKTEIESQTKKMLFLR